MDVQPSMTHDCTDPAPAPVASPTVDPRRTETWLSALLSNISDAVTVLDADGSVFFSAGQVGTGLGLAAEMWPTAEVWGMVHPDDRPLVEAGLAESLARPGEEVTVEMRFRTASGGWADLTASAVNMLHDATVGGVVITTRNITAVRRAERLASSQAAVLELIARSAPLPDIFERCVELVEENGVGGRSSIYMPDGDHLQMRAGRAPIELNTYLQTTANEPEGPPRSLCDVSFATGGPTLIHDLAAEEVVHPGLRALATEIDVAAAWSQPIVALGSGEVIGTLSTVYETPYTPDRHERQVGETACSLVAIAMARVESEQRLAHLALHDDLTGLPNRTLLLDRLDHALARRGTRSPGLAVLFCDIDRFKVVNDSLGHAVGDLLLVAFAHRLLAAIGAGNTVARFGGDEFVVLLDDPEEADDPTDVATRIAATLEHPFALPSGQDVHLTASIGLARAGDHASGGSWLRDADAAMYRAKELGRNRFALFDSAMRDAAVLRLEIENDLRRAAGREEMVVLYQPVVDLASGRICGAEALVRWDHPQRGRLDPVEFIEVAEEIGLIASLGAWVLDRAVADMSSLRSVIGPDRFQLGVNVSARQLDAVDLDRLVDDICRRHGWPHADLLLEVTETSLTSSTAAPLELLDRIRALGVELAIDDFGTGHSSLSRLSQMPVTQVKIDRTFVGSPGSSMVEAVTAVGRALDLRTAAEGVETAEQLAHVRSCGCQLAQGYLFARPLPLDQLIALMETAPRW